MMLDIGGKLLAAVLVGLLALLVIEWWKFAGRR